IGLAFLPATIVMGTLSIRYSDRLVMRFGARRTLLPGLALIVVGGRLRVGRRRRELDNDRDAAAAGALGRRALTARLPRPDRLPEPGRRRDRDG
nr:hypothetical protein [Thermoleophilaceae bacterium]